MIGGRRQLRTIGTALIFTGLLSILVAAGVTPRRAETGGAADTIAYLRWVGGTPQIYRYRLDTRRLERISRPPVLSVAYFSFAPDGRTYVCRCVTDGAPGLVLVNESGGVRSLTRALGDISPRWSPNGRWIVYEHFRDPKHGTTGDLYLVHPDGSGLHRLTSTIGADRDPSWSPDSTMIAFRNGGLRIVRTDGSDLRRLGPHGIEPAWSPDGTQLAYAYPTFGGISAIKVARVDGSGVRVITDGSGYDSSPAWSRDGSQIFFARTRSGRGDIYAASADGAIITRVTASVDRETSPAILP